MPDLICPGDMRSSCPSHYSNSGERAATAQVLIIDDEEMVCGMLSTLAGNLQHEASCAFTLADGLKLATLRHFDLILLDVGLPDGNGLDAIPRLRALPSAPEILIITGAGSPDGAELAVNLGAWDYIEKTASISQMTLLLIRALEYRREKQAYKQSRPLKPEGIIGTGPPMETCFDLLAQAIASDVNVLITGATGTGKELFAQAIHQHSSRAAKIFVVVDCAALPENLVESALFGYEKGAFTGADKAVSGLIAQAHGGTLFLDEVGELPGRVQKAFLRVLQERRFRPLGGKQEIKSDFRLVAATNRYLEEMIEQGGFRQDLFFRLRSLSINLPPLTGRHGDINALIFYHTARMCKQQGLAPKGFSPEFLQVLSAYDWPGNVRELVNVLDTTLAASQQEPTLYPQHLPPYLRTKLARAKVHQRPANRDARERTVSSGGILSTLSEVRKIALTQVEKSYLQDLMYREKGNIKAACKTSGLSRTRLYTLLKHYGIPPSLAAQQPHYPPEGENPTTH